MTKLALLVALAACGDDTAATIDAAMIDAHSIDARVCHCAHPGAVTDRGAIPASLTEGSGMVASRAHPGVLYAHNDSGDSPRVIAFDDHGALIAQIDLANATNVDWEDIRIGPCGGGSCIYVGDIGDNNLARDTKTIYRFPEPSLVIGQNPAPITPEAFPFTYPDGRHNAETLLVHPTTGTIYVVSKEAYGVPSVVYRFPGAPSTSTTTLAKVATLAFPTAGDCPSTRTDCDVSSADIDSSGSAILLRIGSAKLYELDGAFDGVFTNASCSLPVADEPNGESITWNSDGTGYFTISEGVGSRLHYVSCQ